MSTQVLSEIAGVVVKIEAPTGGSVAQDDTLLLIESMKMQIPVVAPTAGRLTRVCVAEGDIIAEGQLLAELD